MLYVVMLWYCIYILYLDGIYKLVANAYYVEAMLFK